MYPIYYTCRLGSIDVKRKKLLMYHVYVLYMYMHMPLRSRSGNEHLLHAAPVLIDPGIVSIYPLACGWRIAIAADVDVHTDPSSKSSTCAPV